MQQPHEFYLLTRRFSHSVSTWASYSSTCSIRERENYIYTPPAASCYISPPGFPEAGVSARSHLQAGQWVSQHQVFTGISPHDTGNAQLGVLPGYEFAVIFLVFLWGSFLSPALSWLKQNSLCGYSLCSGLISGSFLMVQSNVCKATEDTELCWPFCTVCVCVRLVTRSQGSLKGFFELNALNSSSREGVWKQVWFPWRCMAAGLLGYLRIMWQKYYFPSSTLIRTFLAVTCILEAIIYMAQGFGKGSLHGFQNCNHTVSSTYVLQLQSLKTQLWSTFPLFIF